MPRSQKMTRPLPAAVLVAVFAIAAAYAPRGVAKEPEPPPPRFEVYGFAMADWVQDFRRVDPAWTSTLRPSRIPVQEPGIFGNNGEATVSARPSRFGVKTNLETMLGLFHSQFEFDFFGVGVDEGQTTIRLRHAWGELGAFGAGQTHSLFMDIDVFPHVLDYWGPAGMVFLRNPQLRYTPVLNDVWSVAFAVERPVNDIDPGSLREVDTELGASPQPFLPDLSGQVRAKGDWGHVQLGGIVRALGWEVLGNPGNEPNGRKVGWGLDLSAIFLFLEKDKLMVSVVYGQGIASYMNDGGVDLAPEASGATVGAKALPLLGIVAYVDHWWSKTWSTALGYSETRVWNTDLQDGSAFNLGQYASANLVWNPNEQFLTGVEVLWGRRKDNDGKDNSDIRAQLSMKYSFSSL